MNRISLFIIILILSTVNVFNLHAKSTTIKQDINWPEFMGKQDMVWETLPEYWYESAFLGNGMLGLMIYKQPNENYIRLETGNCKVHDHRKSNDLFGIPRLLTGHFALHPKGTIIDGKMRLDIWNAEAFADIRTTKGIIHLRAIVHANDMIIITSATAEGEEKDFIWEWVPARSESPRYLYAKNGGNWIKVPDDYPFNPKPDVTRNGKEGLSVQKLQAGGETAIAWKETQTSKGERILWTSIEHSYPDTNASVKSKEVVDKAVSTGYPKLQKSHRQWWNNYYPTSFITLPEGIKENFYWAQMYKLASATRGDRALIDNTGPWLTETPWPNAWWNLNVQLTYWPLNASDHLDLAASLENALYNHVDQLRMNIPEAYRNNSLGIGRSSNLECATVELGIPGVSSAAEVGLLTWACHNLYLIYRYKMDDVLLRDKLYPLLKGAINYYLHFLKKEADGKLHLPKTYSPEYGTAEDCNFDLSLLRWGCQTLLQSAERLGIKDELIPQWETVLRDLTPYPMDENGFLIGKDTPYAFSHRHYSHLLAIYPLYTVNVEQPGGKELMERSLRFWHSKKGALLGYSLTGASSISAALGNGNDALSYLNGLFGKFLSANTLYRESGPVIETPLSAAQSIHDMLLQSWGGKLRIFPAVPDSWKNLAFDGLRTEGAFKVTANRKNGKTEFIQIKSLAGEPCIVVTDIPFPTFKGKRSFTTKTLQPGTYFIDLKKGEEVVIYQEGTSPDFILRPVNNTDIHCYGKKRTK